MSIISRLIRAENGDGTHAPHDDWWYKSITGMLTASGVRVDQHTARNLSAVWRCLSLTAGTVGRLPLHLYKWTDDGGKERAPQHPLYTVLLRRPNGWMTAFEFRELLTQHICLRGNGYAQIVGGTRGFATQLVPIHPDAVTVEQQRDWMLKYRVRMADGSINTLFHDEMLHVRGISDDGIVGMDLITYFGGTVGLGLAQERFSSKFFSQSPAPGAVAEHPGKLSSEAQDRLTNQFLKRTSGEKAGGLLMLEEGMKYTPMNIGLTAEQAQIISAREHTTQDIARWFGVPNHLVGETTKETSWGSGIEEMARGYLTFTLSILLERWQQAITRDLIRVPDVYFPEFVTEDLLRTDTLKRYEALNTAIGKPWMLRNEGRRIENRNPIAGWDEEDQREMSAPAAPAPAPQPQPSRNGTAPANAYAPLTGA